MPSAGNATNDGNVRVAETTTLGVTSLEKQLETILTRILNKDAVGIPKTCEKNDDIKAHLIHINNYLRACGIEQDEAKIAILFNTLCEEMRDELCGLLDFSSNRDNYNWISRKLLELFQPKETEISALIKLFSCHQSSNQSTREFLAEIRRLGYRLLKELSPEEREKHMIKAFTSGLYHKEARNALGQIPLESLDEAFKLIKKEKSTDPSKLINQSDMYMMKELDTASDIQKLQNQMSVIQKQLAHIVTVLEHSIASPERKTYAEVTRRAPIPNRNQISRPTLNAKNQQNLMPRKPIECWQCGRSGHIQRFCKQNTCQRCGKTGHAASDCVYYRQKRQFRRLENVEDTWTSENDSSVGDLDTESGNHVEFNRRNNGQETAAQIHSLDMENEHEKVLHALTIHPVPKSRKPTVHKSQDVRGVCFRPRKKVYTKEIEELYDYIEGRTRKAPSPPTLISDTRSERARNKPVVKGICQTTATKLFCDTGAEVNVIDHNLVGKLKENDKNIRVQRTRKIIRCANNSKMSVIGWTRLLITVAGARKMCKFWVVPQVFPRIILGIRAMKDLGMSVDPAKDCVWVNGVREPFISKVNSQSLVSANSGKGQLPGLRVESRQM